MKRIVFLFIIILSGFAAIAQTYNPTKGVVVNKPIGQAQAFPVDARSYFYDATNFIWRPYQSTAEVISYLNLAKYRAGQFPIYVNSGGTLNGDGTFTGGVILEYWFKDGVADVDLALRTTSVTGGLGINVNGNTVKVDTATFRKVDSAYALNDSTLRILINGVSRNIVIKGTGTAGGIDSVYVNNAGVNGIETSYISVDTLKTKKLYEQEGAVLIREADSSISIKTKVTQLATYTAMRALATSVLDANYNYMVRASGVNGTFRYDATDIWSADDSAMVIVTGSGKRFKRVTDGYLNAAWFGAVPDDGVDDSWAFQKMFNYIDTATVLRDYKIFIPGGKYNVATSVILPQTIYNPGGGSIPRVEIEGYGATIFVTGAITGWKRTVADMTEANAAQSSNFWSISGMEFTGDATTGQKGMEFHATYGASFKDLRFTGLDTGFVTRFILGSKFENIFYTQNKSVGFVGASLNGIATSATTSNSAFNANTITRNRVYSASGSYAGIMVLAADGVHVWNNIFEGNNPRYDIYWDSEGSSVVNGNTIEEAWFESSGGSYTVNTSMKLRVNGYMTIKNIQNDSQDTLFDWSNSAAGASFTLDGVYYWNWPGKYIKGAPSSGLSFTVKNVPTAQIQNFVNSTYYNDGMPQDVFIPGTQLSGGLGVGYLSSIDQYFRPNPNGAANNRKLFIKGNIYPEDDNTYDIGSASLRYSNIFINTKGYFASTANDGSGSKLQVGGAISLTDGSQIFEPTGVSFFRVSTGAGTEIGYGSGGSLGKIQMNPHLSYLYGGTEKFRVSSAGEVWINPSGVSDLGAYTLQNTGGHYQQGVFRLGGQDVAISTDIKILVKGTDSLVRTMEFPIVESSYTPTRTDVTNIGTSSVTTCYYRRLGNTIEVWGEITIDPTATGDTQVDLSLPISSALGNSYDISGTAVTYDNNQTFRIYADTTNDRMIVRGNASVDANSHVYSFHAYIKYIAP